MSVCRYLGKPTQARRLTVLEPYENVIIHNCSKHSSCTLEREAQDTKCCKTCPDNSAFKVGISQATPSPSNIVWTYGVTTVPSRRGTLLPITLLSLKEAGFNKPRLFVDGDRDGPSWEREFGLEVTARYPRIRTHGNWMLSLIELFTRTPTAHRFAIFQDDLFICKNTRQYLDHCVYPERGYWNLYTFPNYQGAFSIGQTGRFKTGWEMAPTQQGLGALGLVFSRDAVLALFSNRHMIERSLDPNRGWQAVDGGIVTALNKQGFREYVHCPSLLQHSGTVSSMGHAPYNPTETFRGQDFDAMLLLNELREQAVSV